MWASEHGHVEPAGNIQESRTLYVRMLVRKSVVVVVDAVSKYTNLGPGAPFTPTPQRSAQVLSNSCMLGGDSAPKRLCADFVSMYMGSHIHCITRWDRKIGLLLPEKK